MLTRTISELSSCENDTLTNERLSLMDRLINAIRLEVLCGGGGESEVSGSKQKGINVNDKFWNMVSAKLLEIIGIELKVTIRSFVWNELLDSHQFIFYKADDHTTLIHEISFTQTTDDSYFISVPYNDRISFYTNGRPLKLTDMQVKALGMLANSKFRGVTQSDAAKLLSMDSRSFFHQLKSLIELRVITKMPVTHQRAFTYLLHLTCFAPKEENLDFSNSSQMNKMKITKDLESPLSSIPSLDQDQDQDQLDNNVDTQTTNETRVQLSNFVTRQKIMDTLKAAPQKTLAATEIYRLLGGNNSIIRTYRRNVTWLICNGFVECFAAEELGGVVGRILKYKKPLTKTLIKPIKKTESDLVLMERGSALVRGLTLEKQVHDFISRSGLQGATVTDIMWNFSINRKLAYRIGERLSLGNKTIFTDSDVIKVAEFHGRERRNRFFTNLGRTATTTTREDSNIEMIMTSSSNNDTMIHNSVNRARRVKVLLEILEEAQVTEVSKTLIQEIQNRLDEKDYLMDIKTMKRIISTCANEGRLNIIVIALPNGFSKTILTKPLLTTNDEIVASFIEKVKQSKTELGLSSFSIEVDNGNNLSLLQQQQQQQSSLLSKKSLEKEHKYKMHKHGFVHGILSRCRLIHRYLLSRILDTDPVKLDHPEVWLCETLSTFFRSMPFDLFLATIGLGEMSERMLDFIENLDEKSTPLSQLPPLIKDELHKRRLDRHKQLVRFTMEQICALGLASADNRYPSVAFRLSYQYRVSRMANIIDLSNGAVIETIDLTAKDGFDRYWQWLESQSQNQDQSQSQGQISSSKSNRNVLATAKDEIISLNKVYELATKKENWLQSSPISRALKKYLRSLIVQEKQGLFDEKKIDEKLCRAAEDYEIDFETLYRLYKELHLQMETRQRERTEERRYKRLKKMEVRRSLLPKPSGGGSSNELMEEDEDGDEGEEEEEGKEGEERMRKVAIQSLSKEEMELFCLAFALLQRPELLSASDTYQWGLVEGLYKVNLLGRHITAEDVRVVMSRYTMSYSQIRKIADFEATIAYLRAVAEAGYIPREPSNISSSISLDRQSNDDNESALQEYFTNLFVYYNENIARINEIRQRVCKTQSKTSPYYAPNHSIPIATGNFAYLEPSQWKRMTKLQQFSYFLDISPYQVTDYEHENIEQDCEDYDQEIALLKKALFSVPVQDYDAIVAQTQLSKLDPIRLAASIEKLINEKVISRCETFNFMPRIPGSGFYLNKIFVEIVDGCMDWPLLADNVTDGEAEDLVELMKKFALNYATIDFSIKDNEISVDAKINRDGLNQARRTRFDNALLEYEKNSRMDSFSPVWFDINNHFRSTILRAACRYLYRIILDNPGINRDQLYRSNILSKEECLVCIKILEQSEMIEIESHDSFLFIIAK